MPYIFPLPSSGHNFSLGLMYYPDPIPPSVYLHKKRKINYIYRACNYYRVSKNSC